MTEFSKWKTIGYAAAIFVTGGISGGALGVYETKTQLLAPPIEPGQQEMAGRIMNRLRDRLGLSPDQVKRVNPIIDGAAADLRSIHEDAAQQINKVFDDFYSKLSAVLTPEQKVKLDQMQKERRDLMQGRWGADGGRRHPGPGGPRRDPPRHDGEPEDENGPGTMVPADPHAQ